MAGSWIPLYVNPEGLRVAVLGGGEVGERRALLFARSGARVRVYALDFTEGLRRAASEGLVELVEADLRGPALLEAVEWANLVVVAVGDEEVAARAAREALARGRLVNNAVRASEGNVVVPYRASTSYGVHLASTSLGASGPSARRALEYCASLLEASVYHRTLHAATSALKALLKSRVPDAAARVRAMLAADASEDLHRAAMEGDLRGACRAALEAAWRSLGLGEPGGGELGECLRLAREGGGGPGE